MTFGFGIGWSYLANNPKDYFLTSDASHKLEIQKLGRSSLVISSSVSIKFGSLSLQNQSDWIIDKEVLVSSKRTLNAPVGFASVAGGITYAKPKFSERLSLIVALNLAEVDGGEVTFNKAIDGGLGIGCYVNEFTQFAVFFDMIRYRQMRDYFVNEYKGKSIPTGF